MARLMGIATREKKRAPMVALERAAVTRENGVADDFRGKPGKRQVTVLSKEGWAAACLASGEALDWTVRRANLLVEGLDLRKSTGCILAIGDLRLLITRETDPCERMAEVSPALERALLEEWRGGVCCRVLEAGKIAVGDPVELIHAD